MILRLTKLFTLTLILCICVAQLLLPFLHAHYKSSSVHAKGTEQLLHVHVGEINVDTYGDSFYRYSSHVETDVFSMGHLLPNHNDFDDLAFIPIVFLAVLFGSTPIIFICSLLTKPVYQRFIYARSPSRAPPQYA